MSPADYIVRGYDSIQVALPLPDDRDLQVIQAAAGELCSSMEMTENGEVIVRKRRSSQEVRASGDGIRVQ
jgi:hypothetical protein